MRWYILKTLLHKEALRHTANRGGLALAGLLITTALLLAIFNPAGEKSVQLIGGVHHCIIHIDERSPLRNYLVSRVPDYLQGRLVFYKPPNPDIVNRELSTPQTGTAVIEVLGRTNVEGKRYEEFWIWYPTGDRGSVEIYENWFWREVYQFYRDRAAEQLKQAGVDVESRFPTTDIFRDELWLQRRSFESLRNDYRQLLPATEKRNDAIPEFVLREEKLKGSTLDMRAAIATALVMFSLFFTCVYLMPSLTCEEHERGLLLAQALSPATAMEILGAKFLFYPTFGILLAALLGGLHNPGVLTQKFFWFTLLTLAVGTLGIGMTIASLARTQRSASLSALCYALAIAMVLLICQQNNIGYFPWIVLEYHAPNLLHATLTNQVSPGLWWNLLGAAILAVGWVFVAAILFRQRGWQ